MSRPDIEAIEARVKAGKCDITTGRGYCYTHEDDCPARPFPEQSEMIVLIAYIKKLEAVERAARKRLNIWTRETYTELVAALEQLDPPSDSKE